MPWPYGLSFLFSFKYHFMLKAIDHLVSVNVNGIFSVSINRKRISNKNTVFSVLRAFCT